MVLSSANKPREFRVVFSDPTRTFYSSGDKVSGSVRLEASAPCRLTRLRVTAAGCARVESRRRSQEVEYLKYEDEVRLDPVLNTGEEAAGRLRLRVSPSPNVPPCPQILTATSCFLRGNPSASSSASSFLLPGESLTRSTSLVLFGSVWFRWFRWFCCRRLVSSFKGKFGSVRYYVRAELQWPSQHALQCEREFEVEEPLDVNRPDLLVRPAQTEPEPTESDPND